MRGRTTKRVSRANASAARDGVRREYRFDYTKARPNRFAAPRRGKTTAVVLDPDVASVFDSPESVNRLLRAVIAASPAGVKRSRRRRRSQAAMRMRNPPHPGEIIKALCLEPLGVTITQAAKALGVSRKTLSAILNGRAGISPEMAVRLSMAFGTSAESWLNQQTQHDLWHADRRRRQLRVAKLTPA